jgi:hypothetical protein
MSSTIAAVTPSGSSASPACAAQLYNIPVQDASCAIPYDSSNNATDIMSGCCNSASVVSYYDNCGLYCLAEGQSVEDLTSCLMQSGAQPQNVFCRGNVTATATGSSNQLPPSAQATVVSGGSASSDGSNGGNSGGSGGSSDDGLNGVDGGDDSSNNNGAAAIQGGFGVGKIAVVVLGLLAVPFWID